MATLNLPKFMPDNTYDFVSSGILDPSFTITRKSAATFFNQFGVLTTASAGTPRLDYDPATGKSLGLLLETTSTNIFENSVNMTNGLFSINNGATKLTNITDTPFPGHSAVGFSGASTFGSGINFIGNIPCSPGNIFSVSVFAKQSGGVGTSTFLPMIHIRNSSDIAVSNIQPEFDLKSGTVVKKTNTVFTAIQYISDGWYRVSYSFVIPAGASYIRTCLYSAPVSDGGKFVGYFTGLQVENTGRPTSYIPTTGTAATRAGELFGLNSQKPKTIVGVFDMNNTGQTGGSYIWSGYAGKQETKITRSYFSDNNENQGSNPVYIHWDNGTWGGGIKPQIVEVVKLRESFKLGVSVSSTDKSVSVNGKAAMEKFDEPLSPELEYISSLSFFSHQSSGHIKKLMFYNTTLSTTQLAQMTK